ncbi:aldehyde-activating protein [Burkholderia pseudomultivorans]|uniref:GFA family protein n=1 Tax=Burkholderia pseudomultivorans TaxID=1207504 RepID=UPI0007590616|nr:GFA family protein [Burkholderia pseudomultivorans]KVC38960.1 aldehyde-activating protein [Burkholderia pseudomultivorans]
MTRTQSVRCLCGAVTVTLRGEPAARANCHCATCRDFYGTAMLSATAWQPEQVSVAGGGATFRHPSKSMSRTWCAACGEIVFGTNRLGMRVVPNSVTARAHGGRLPDALQPTMHLFYRQRVIDVVDALPKFLDGWDGPTLDTPN